MRNNYPRGRRLAAILAGPALLASLILAQSKEDEEAVFELSPFCVSGPSFGATPGGAQDINYARSQIKLGNIPHPNTFRAEGLLSEHDLPLAGQVDCDAPICVYGEAMPAKILQLPEASHLAQIGFASGLDAAAWRRAPLNLIAVIDKSGSMSGQPLELVRQSLLQVLAQLGERDQLSIVLYGDRSHVHLSTTRTIAENRELIEGAIRGIVSSGSTNLESGLQVGYQVADRSAPSFEGVTRLMLFTDERPNTGDTSKAGFMGQMRDGSKKGYGLTTIGVGTQFGAELANAISAVRGGNLFYFPERSSMVEKFENEFDTMVTELAYDMDLTIQPKRGFRISGVYGIPGDMLEWKDDRSISLKIETLFLSLRKGAIYFSLAAENETDLPNRGEQNGKAVAAVSLSYKLAGQPAPVFQTFEYRPVSRSAASLGLVRGELLINQYVSLKKATTEHYVNNDQEKAYQIVREVASLIRSSGDEDLQGELETIGDLENNLAFLSGHGGESHSSDKRRPLAGVWVGYPEENPDADDQYFVRFHGDRIMEIAEADNVGNIVPTQFALARETLPAKKRGQAGFLSESEFATLRPTLADFPESLDDADYLELSCGLTFQVKGDRLTVEKRSDKNGGSATLHTLRRYKGAKPSGLLAKSNSPKIEPISGLPEKR